MVGEGEHICSLGAGGVWVVDSVGSNTLTALTDVLDRRWASTPRRCSVIIEGIF
jgi:hypothetical protein